MSEKLSEMYKLDRTVGLVTVASGVVQNLALLDVDEFLCADSLAVIHEGYINYIPLINTTRRCKYVSVNSGINRGKGCALSVKWHRLGYETFFVILSSEGLHIYDAELTDSLYHYKFKKPKSDKDIIPLGSAVVNEFICVGTDNGFIYLFKEQGGHDFELLHRVKVGEFLLFDGLSDFIYVATRQSICSWVFDKCLFYRKENLNSDNITSVAAVLKAVPELVITGYENGELVVYSTEHHKTLAKMQAHKGKITCVDYSPIKLLILTASLDHNIKVWQFNFIHSSMSAVFSLESNYEYCGVGFLNLHATEFCAVKINNVHVDVFLKTDVDDDDE